MINMDKEFRRFEDLQVAEDGEVILQSGKHTYGYKMSSGHRRVRYKGKWYFVHRLVAECFLNGGEPIDSKVYAVHHINGNPEDNRAENLLILTHEDHSKLHNTGKVLSEETKQKIAEAKKGERHPMFGKHQSVEHKQKRAEAKKKPIIGTNKETGFTVEFKSAKDAAIALNIYAGNITTCCKGRLKSTGGWHFEYKKSS